MDWEQHSHGVGGVGFTHLFRFQHLNNKDWIGIKIEERENVVVSY